MITQKEPIIRVVSCIQCHKAMLHIDNTGNMAQHACPPCDTELPIEVRESGQREYMLGMLRTAILIHCLPDGIVITFV